MSIDAFKKPARDLEDIAVDMLKDVPVPAFVVGGLTHDDPTVQHLLELLQAEYVGLYGLTDPDPSADLHTAVQPEGDILLLFPNVLKAEAAGIVAWTRLEGTEDVAVMHRMYVHFAHRGHDYSKALLASVESSARRAGMRRMVLETGTAQTVAINLYRGARYEDTEPFGFYATGAAADWTTSLFMGKDLV